MMRETRSGLAVFSAFAASESSARIVVFNLADADRHHARNLSVVDKSKAVGTPFDEHDE